MVVWELGLADGEEVVRIVMTAISTYEMRYPTSQVRSQWILSGQSRASAQRQCRRPSGACIPRCGACPPGLRILTKKWGSNAAHIPSTTPNLLT